MLHEQSEQQVRSFSAALREQTNSVVRVGLEAIQHDVRGQAAALAVIRREQAAGFESLHDHMDAIHALQQADMREASDRLVREVYRAALSFNMNDTKLPHLALLLPLPLKLQPDIKKGLFKSARKKLSDKTHVHFRLW